ncbi:hypothetical protein Tsubulata_048963 [Turnera subulata]|uniref:MATH domain-containing protein n=1 Tax=Turnera subulata TaxID=218843 RepID=A0A9Q0JBH7_9ROSI|nr:hypothetical protein Tsubulata_048963 [Turnera subulata]
MLLSVTAQEYGAAEAHCHRAAHVRSSLNLNLTLYPNGIKKADGVGSDHISLYLAIAMPDTVSNGWEVNAYVNFFVFDQIRDRFLQIQDASVSHWRFHNMKTECGIANLLPHSVLNDPSSGYVVNGRCVIGVEMFMITKNTYKGESLTTVKQPNNGSFFWKIDNFEALVGKSASNKLISSSSFIVEGKKWCITLNPLGEEGSEGHLSIFLACLDIPVSPERRIFVNSTLRIRDQINGNHFGKLVDGWFETTKVEWGFPDFMSIPTLVDSSKGYLVKNSVIIEVIFHHMFFVKNFA